MRGGPTFLKSSVIVLLCRSEIIVGTAVTDLENLNAMEVIESQGVKGQVVLFNHQRQGGHSYSNGQQNQNSHYNIMICRGLQHWLAARDISRSKIHGKSTKFLLYLCKQRVLGQRNKSQI